MEGRKLGCYIVERRIGKGAAGEVYLGHDTSLDRPVAIKFLSDDWVDDAESQQRFLLEARASAKLKHPGIVQVHTVDMRTRPPYMVMEYVDGESLERRIQREGRLPWREALRIVRDTAAALAAAHGEAVIHRDIKPGNIMLDQEGRARVTDFGLARLLDAQTRVTIQKVSIGSPAYMSPEQCRGDDVTPASDLFSLGITLFEMLTGRLPFIGFTAHQVADKIVSERIPKLTTVMPDLPVHLENFIELLTAKDAAQRYPNAQAVIKHIDRLAALDQAAQPPAIATPPTPNPSPVATAPVTPAAPRPAAQHRHAPPRTPEAPPEPLVTYSPWKLVGAIVIAGAVALLLTWFIVSAIARPSAPDTRPPVDMPADVESSR